MQRTTKTRSWLYAAALTTPLLLTGCNPRVSIELPGAAVYPEGIAIDADGDIYVGSFGDGTIFRVDPHPHHGGVDVLTSEALTRGAVGMTVDEAHGVLLVCDSSALDPVSSDLVAIDLDTGDVVAKHPVPPAAEGVPVFCNDVVIDGGTVYLTDSFGGGILQLPAEAVLVDGTPATGWSYDPDLLAPGDPPFGANGIAVWQGELFVVNFAQGTLLHATRDPNGAALDVVPVPLTDADGNPIALVGPDGIAASSDGDLLVVENGIFAGGDGNRLRAVSLQGGVGQVVTVAEDFDVPTTVAQGEHRLWVVEGQLDHLFGLDPAPPSPFVITGVLR
ncbi:MAG: hypothetical protein K0V04_35570 [Deltaproteobacteria bacterium]|nr:hypothetical protein [Deltaproteobacteria bacterium]